MFVRVNGYYSGIANKPECIIYIGFFFLSWLNILEKNMAGTNFLAFLIPVSASASNKMS